jgi:hypothetical protein
MRRSFLAFALVLTLVSTPALSGVHEDMVALDRAYVPALALTGQPKAEPAQAAMKRLRTEWNTFHARYATAPAGYGAAAWTRCSGEIERAISAAEAAMATGKGGLAHAELERIREAQLALRRGAKQPYFLDDLTVFHEAMEKLAGPASGKTGATITDAEIASIVAALPEAEHSWQDVVARRGEASRHGLTTEAAQAVQRDIDAETQVLADLKAALAAGDRALIAEKANASKPAFSRLFQRFGDFSGLR